MTSSTCDDIMTSFQAYYGYCLPTKHANIWHCLFRNYIHLDRTKHWLPPQNPLSATTLTTDGTLACNHKFRYLPQTYRTVFTPVSMALIITLHLNKSMELIKCQLYSISGSTHTQTVSVSGSVIGNSGRLNGGHIDYAHSHNYTTCGAGTIHNYCATV